MAGFLVNCAARKKNTGLSSLCQDLSNTRKFILVPKGWSLPEAAARLLANWTDGIHAEAVDRIYPFPVIHNFTDNSEEMVMDEGALGSIFVRDGKINFQFEIESSRYKHEAMKSHSLQKYDVVIVDANDRLHGVIASNGDFKGGNLQQFIVGRLMPNDGTAAGTKTMITMIFGDTQEWETRPAVISGLEWSPTELEGLTDIYLSDAVGTVAGVTLTATDKSGNAFNGDMEGGAFDFVITNSSGVVQTITAITSSGGENVLTATLLAGVYTVDLSEPADMVTKGYASAGPVTVTF